MVHHSGNRHEYNGLDVWEQVKKFHFGRPFRICSAWLEKESSLGDELAAGLSLLGTGRGQTG